MRIAEPSRILAYLPLYMALEGTEHELLNFDGQRIVLKQFQKVKQSCQSAIHSCLIT